jgi:predicted RNase H-like nuclease
MTPMTAMGDTPRIALEAYPGLLARELLGGAVSYKSDDKARQTPERRLARQRMLIALTQGHTRLGLRLQLTPDQAETLVADASGDSLDAVLCMVQAAWAWRAHQQGHPLWGLPPGVDPLEGWIITA